MNEINTVRDYLEAERRSEKYLGCARLPTKWIDRCAAALA